MTQTPNFRHLVLASRSPNCESFAKIHQWSKKLHNIFDFERILSKMYGNWQKQVCVITLYWVMTQTRNFRHLVFASRSPNCESLAENHQWSKKLHNIFDFERILSKMYGNWQKQVCVITLYWVMTQTPNFRHLVFISRYPNCESFAKNHQRSKKL